MLKEIDLYSVLQVTPDARLEEIKSAYRRLAKKYHPDVNPSPDAVHRMKDLNHAYALLSDPDKRSRYDRKRQRTPSAAAPPAGTRHTPPAPRYSRHKSVKEQLFVSEALIADAIALAKQYPALTSAILQRRLRITYPRAVNLFAELIEKGILDDRGYWTARYTREKNRTSS